MSVRPVFIPQTEGQNYVKKIDIDFTWFPGFSNEQKRKSIKSLHEGIRRKTNTSKILEISTKSEERIGVKASAFNLRLRLFDIEASLESIYQGSKVFETDGPHTDLYTKEPLEVKKDGRISRDKKIIGFEFENVKWQTEPKTAFYDWIYLKAVKSNIEDLNNTIYEKIFNYNAFTDIEFNPKKSINCQARSCALYVSLFKNELLDIALESEEAFLEIISKDSFYKIEKKEYSEQGELDLKF